MSSQQLILETPLKVKVGNENNDAIQGQEACGALLSPTEYCKLRCTVDNHLDGLRCTLKFKNLEASAY